MAIEDFNKPTPSGTYRTIGTFQFTIGTTPTQMPQLRTARVMIKSDDNNTGNIYVGNSAVTTSNGFKIIGGQAYESHYSLLGDIWVVSNTTAQLIYLVVEYEVSK